MIKDGIITRIELADARTEAQEVAALHSPDLSKMLSVRVDENTTIFIEHGKDPELAKKKYLARRAAKTKSLIAEVRGAFYLPKSKYGSDREE